MQDSLKLNVGTRDTGEARSLKKGFAKVPMVHESAVGIETVFMIDSGPWLLNHDIFSQLYAKMKNYFRDQANKLMIHIIYVTVEHQILGYYQIL